MLLMKLKYILLLLLPLIVVPLGAIDMSVGVRAGVAFNNLHGSFVTEQTEIFQAMGATEVTGYLYATYLVNAFFRLNIFQFLALQAEVLIGPAGGALVATNGTTRLTGITTTALKIPLLLAAQFKLGPGRVSIASGGYLSLPIAGIVQVYREGSLRSEVLLNAEPFESLSYGPIAALAYDIPLGPGFITVDFRFNWGAVSLVPEIMINDTVLQVYSFEISAGYGFTL